MDSKEFVQKLKDFREEYKLTQEDVAKEMGVHFSTVNRWENCKARPSKLALQQFESLEKKMKKRIGRSKYKNRSRSQGGSIFTRRANRMNSKNNKA
jgi:transcriptional regulator with XRE-family HTH domain